jgi:hypothetical protein
MFYEFNLPVTISPAKDTFKVGDTIWLENSFSHKLMNHENGKIYTVEGFDFKTTMVITDLNSPFPAKSYPGPRITTYKGKTEGEYVQTTDYTSIHLSYDYNEGMYYYKAAFIPDKPGKWLINFFSFHDGEKVDITKCNNETLFVEYATNNALSNNYEIVKEAKDHKFSSLSFDDFNKIGAFAFYVAE